MHRPTRDLDNHLSVAYHAHLAVAVALIAGFDLARIVSEIVTPARAQLDSCERLANLYAAF